MERDEKKLPKYCRISNDILHRIKSGELTAGSKTPSENEIIDEYKVSNTTARKALQILENSGYVQRVKGKGTIVLSRKIERSAERILSFTKNMLEEGRRPSTKLVSINMYEPSKTLTIKNREYTMEGPVCKIQRLRFGDTVPILFETRYISMRFCTDIHKRDLEGSLYQVYEKNYGLELYEIQQELSTMIMDRSLMPYFDLESPIPVFNVEGVTFCGKNMILEMEESVYRGDIYRFNVTAKRK